MRFTNTFLIIALLTLSYTYSFEFASLAEVSEIQTTPYGKSLLETISLSLEQKGNVGEVQRLLNDLLYKLNQDQAKDDAWWKKENARLKLKIKNLTAEIEALRKEILRLLDQKAKYEKLRDQAAKNLVQYRKQLAATHKSLKKNKERRAADKAEFKRSQNEHTDVLNAIDAVIKELRKLKGSVSGGRPQHVRAGAEETRDLKKSFMQISQDEAEIQLFIQLATEADQKALRNLIRALKRIRASTVASYNHDINHEKRSAKTYKRLRAILKKDVQDLNRVITQEEKNYKAYKARVERLIKKIAATRALRKAKQQEKKLAIKERLAKKARYLADKAQRDEERRVIKRIQAIVQKRLANMSKYLNSQSD